MSYMTSMTSYFPYISYNRVFCACMKKLTLECQLFVGLYQSINQSINQFICQGCLIVSLCFSRCRRHFIGLHIY